MAVLLTGCATMPEPLRGEFPPLTPGQARQDGLRDLWVRWGGSIAEVEPGEAGTCLNIVARPLSSAARPRLTDLSLGRFRACTESFLEPEIFRPGRAVTVVGYLSGQWQGQVGEYAYDYPLVEADVVFLWPRYSRYPVYRVYRPYPYPFYPPVIWVWG